MIGSFGDVVCFSFDGIKNITCGEGGCLVSFDAEATRLASDARLLSVENDAQQRFAGARSWDPDVRRQGWRYHMKRIYKIFIFCLCGVWVIIPNNWYSVFM